MGAEEKGGKAVPKAPIMAIFTEDGLLIPSSEESEVLSSKGYGKPSERGLNLALYEGLYLLSRGVIEVQDGETGEEITFQELLRRYRDSDEDAWVKYLIYRDLRSRGYVVREGFGLGIDFRVYERGKYGKGTADRLIYGIREGKPVSVEDLARSLSYVQNLKKKLVLAVLNRRGEIVYYSLSKLAFKPSEAQPNLGSE
ncbi:MAG: tRNA intron endonuclease [Candidatus Bathyarchaeota archaeon B26-2]|nr:MAG: tRNA intron endonuclease [Candidatus Bathyarchaeota archaeon B26-2]